MSGSFGSLLNFASNLKLGAWAWGLQPASWRGVPFAVRTSTIRRGRRIAIHEYPNSDSVWVEDLGRGTRAVKFSGFLVGDDVFAQRDQMAAAAEVAGSGLLVHPSLGSLSVTLISFSAGERADLGRVVEIEFSFIEGQTAPLFPTSALATQLQAITAAVQVGLATARDYISTVTTALTGINAAVTFVSNVFGTVRGVVTGFATLAQNTAADSGAAASAVRGLPGSNGRYAYGALSTSQPTTATIASALAAVTVSRAAVASAGEATAAIDDPALLPTSVQVLMEAVRVVAQDPADQIRLLMNLAAYDPTIQARSAPVGAAITTIQTATVHLFRAAALVSVANATSAYQPTSYDDAVATLQAVTALLETVSIAAADAGQTASYLALRALNAAITNDLLTRAASLPRLKTVTSRVPLPSLALAYSLYADATRSDELIARANPIAPLFMPLSFQALSA